MEREFEEIDVVELLDDELEDVVGGGNPICPW